MEFVTEQNIKNFLENLSNNDEKWKGLKHEKSSVNIYSQSDFYDYTPYYYYNVYIYMFDEETQKYDRYLMVIDDQSCSINHFDEEIEKYRPVGSAKFEWISFMIKDSSKEYSKDILEYCNRVINVTSESCKKQINELVDNYESLKQVTLENSLNVVLPTPEELEDFKTETEQQIKELVDARNKELKPYFEIEQQANNVVKQRETEMEM